MKKAITLLLALVMVLSLAACGGSTAAPATEAPKAETPAAPAATEAAPAEEGKVFNIYAWNEESRASSRSTTPFPMASPLTGSSTPLTAAFIRTSWTRLC